MRPGDPVGLTGFGQALGGVLADGLQQVVAGAGAVDHDQRPVDQPAEQVHDGRRVQRLAAGDGLDGVERPAAAEHRQPLQQHPLGVGEQLVAPVDGGSQRALPGLRGARAGGQQGEAVAHPPGELVERQGRDAGGGELDGQRHAVEVPADVRDRGVVPLVELEVRQDAAGPVEEEPYGGAAGQLGHVGCLGWDGQRIDRALDLAAGGQRLAAGGEQPYAGRTRAAARRAGRRRRRGARSCRGRAATARSRRWPSNWSSGGGRGHVPDLQRGQHGCGHLDRVGDPGEPHERDPVGEAVRGGPGGLQREAGLPDAAGAGDGDQPRGAQQLADPRAGRRRGRGTT